VDLTNVKVVATWPADLRFVSHDAKAQGSPTGNSITWDFGTLKPKQKVQWTILKAAKAGEYVLETTTTAKEIKNAMVQQEITTFVD
jgi:hypothetical protein